MIDMNHTTETRQASLNDQLDILTKRLYGIERQVRRAKQSVIGPEPEQGGPVDKSESLSMADKIREANSVCINIESILERMIECVGGYEKNVGAKERFA